MSLQRVRVGVLSALAVAACWLAAAPAFAADSAARSSAIERGRTTFQQSCAVCHGEKGKGNGQAASSLNPRPVDLTQLTRRNGTFPAGHLEAVLKGQDAATTHTSVMMVWRALFLAGANGDEAAANGRVSDLIAFIETLQAK